MATRQTFHTPSFGDEEFEIFSAPTFDHNQQQSHQQQLSANNTTELSLLSPTSSSSTSSLHNILPVVTTNQSINQWQTHSAVGGGSDISVDTGYSEKGTGVMGDATLIAIDENDAGRFSSTISNEDLLGTGGETKTKKKRDPNEPAKPISAYALFFRDTQTAIKGQNPNASFGEISRIVARMWDALDPEHKNVYKKKTELAKKEYLKSLAAYKNSLANKSENIESTSGVQDNEVIQNQNNVPVNIISSNSQNMLQSSAGVSRIPPTQDSVIQNNNPTGNTSTILNVSNAPSTIPNHLLTSSISNQSTEIPSLHQPNNNSLTTGIAATATSALTPNNVAAMNQSPTNTLETNQQQTQKCIREGCTNTAIINPDWEDEYCSNECVIIHCRDVFSQWVQSNNLPTPAAESYSAA